MFLEHVHIKQGFCCIGPSFQSDRINVTILLTWINHWFFGTKWDLTQFKNCIETVLADEENHSVTTGWHETFGPAVEWLLYDSVHRQALTKETPQAQFHSFMYISFIDLHGVTLTRYDPDSVGSVPPQASMCLFCDFACRTLPWTDWWILWGDVVERLQITSGWVSIHRRYIVQIPWSIFMHVPCLHIEPYQEPSSSASHDFLLRMCIKTTCCCQVSKLASIALFSFSHQIVVLLKMVWTYGLISVSFKILKVFKMKDFSLTRCAACSH